MIKFPAELGKAYWDKKKDPISDKPEPKLEALEKKHQNVDWTQFDDSWTKDLKTPDEVDEAFKTFAKLHDLEEEADRVCMRAGTQGLPDWFANTRS